MTLLPLNSFFIRENLICCILREAVGFEPSPNEVPVTCPTTGLGDNFNIHQFYLMVFSITKFVVTISNPTQNELGGVIRLCAVFHVCSEQITMRESFEKHLTPNLWQPYQFWNVVGRVIHIRAIFQSCSEHNESFAFLKLPKYKNFLSSSTTNKKGLKCTSKTRGQIVYPYIILHSTLSEFQLSKLEITW